MHLRTIEKEHALTTTPSVSDDLIEEGSSVNGVKEKTSLVRLELDALIARESAGRHEDRRRARKGAKIPGGEESGRGEMALVHPSG